MRNFFYIITCFLLLSCTTAQEIINSGQVKAGMSQSEYSGQVKAGMSQSELRSALLLSQSELRSALPLTYLSEDPFLSGCFRQYFQNEGHLIIAAENKTKFFIFEGARSQGTCEAIGNGKLAAVRNSYPAALNFIENNYTNYEYLRDFESRYNSSKNKFIHDYKKKLVDLNYLDIASTIVLGNKLTNEFHAAIIKFLVDEGECDLALLIKSSLPLLDLNMVDSFDYCKNDIFTKSDMSQTLGLKEIYFYCIFTQEFSTLLNKAWNRIEY